MKTIIMARTALFAEKEAQINRGDNDYYRHCVSIINKFNLGKIRYEETNDLEMIYSILK
jgi:hypothetical protein